jgi:hypothetical protein
MADEPLALDDAGLGIKVGTQLGFEPFGNSARLKLGEFGKSGGSSAKRAGHVEEMARASGGTEQSSSTWNSADEDNIGDGDGRLGEVAAGEWGLVARGEC